MHNVTLFVYGYVILEFMIFTSFNHFWMVFIKLFSSNFLSFDTTYWNKNKKIIDKLIKTNTIHIRNT